jgi:hypothetical protein
MANVIRFPRVFTSRLRVSFTHQPGAASGLTELEAWASVPLRQSEPRASALDLAYNPTGSGFPHASASFTAPSERVESVDDMRIAFSRYSSNHWTARGSPNASDWVEIDFGSPRAVGVLELYLWGDGTSVKAPRRLGVQFWNGSSWLDAHVSSQLPERPTTFAVNTIRIEPVQTSKVRVVLEHDLPAASGMTELMIWEHLP